MAKIRIGASLILVVAFLLGFFVYQTQVSGSRPFRLGLDLAGGALLTYEADVTTLATDDVEGAMAALREVIERRVNLFGVSEPVVQVEDTILGGERRHRLIVELPGVTDLNAAIDALGETPLLEFKLVNPDVYALTPEELKELSPEEIYIPTELTGRYLEHARVEFVGGAQGLLSEPVVAISFNGEGARLFEQITREHRGEILAIFLDGVSISEPVIQAVIPSGQAVIEGGFTPEGARDLAQNLSFGALPVPIELVGVQNVGATLGTETAVAGLVAGLWGLILVGVFMVLWYRVPGFVAVLALGVYTIFMLAIFKFLPITLTAAGVAGFILSVGMAVDANILIFERMKEELLKHTSLKMAMEEGFRRAWLSIRDGNITSILTAVILFYTTTSLVQGFALTLGLGVLVSMITAIGVTRILLFAVSSERWGERARVLLFGSGFTR